MPYAAPVKDEPPRRPAENRVGASETPARSKNATLNSPIQGADHYVPIAPSRRKSALPARLPGRQYASEDHRRATVQERRNRPTQTVCVSQKAVQPLRLSCARSEHSGTDRVILQRLLGEARSRAFPQDEDERSAPSCEVRSKSQRA